ncbi:MAG TPA: VOC family protein [Actinomycetota bacterium]|nr:VOC family protein [Actinomycetota bacterium]
MSPKEIRPGSIVWTDLTVEKAPAIAEFYEAVAGWKSEEVDVADYVDFNMVLPATGRAVAGICHAKGQNANLPPQWLIYIVVKDLDASMSECWAKGGRVILGPKEIGPGERYCVVRDPAGAVAALIQQKEPV